MKITEDSRVYRYAKLSRAKNEPPMETGCDVLLSALFTTWVGFIIALLIVGSTIALTLLGAMALSHFNVSEPQSLALSILMAFATGIVMLAAAGTAFWAAGLLCKRIAVEESDGEPQQAGKIFTIRRSSWTYRYAIRFGLDPKNGCDVFAGMVVTTIVFAVIGIAAVLFCMLSGMATVVVFGIDKPEEVSQSLALAFVAGTPIVAGAASLFLIGSYLCKKVVIERPLNA